MASKLESANVRAKRAEVNAERQKTLTESCLAKNVHIENQLLALSAEQRALEIALEGALSAQHGSCEKRRRCAPKW